MNKEDKKQIVEVVGKALEDVVLPQFFEIKETLKDHSEKFKKIDQRFDKVDERLDDIDHHLEEVDHRLGKVELNTKVYPYDKEHVETKLSNHELRIGKLELKKV